jgi:hypothetical protein
MSHFAAARHLRWLLCAAWLWLGGACVQGAEWTTIVPNSAVALRDARALTIGPDDVLYIADTGNQRIVAIDTTGKLIAETGGFGSSNGQFQNPEDVAAEWGSSVWVLDYGNRRVQRFSRALSWQATYDVQAASGQEQARPGAIAAMPGGDLIVYDRESESFLRFDPGFVLQATFTGVRGYVGDLRSMAFVRDAGLFWTARSRNVIFHADALLNSLPDVNVDADAGRMVLAVADTMLLIAAGDSVLKARGGARIPLTSAQMDSAVDVAPVEIAAVVMTSAGSLIVMERASGRIMRELP